MEVEVVGAAGHSPIISRFESLNAQSSRTMNGWRSSTMSCFSARTCWHWRPFTTASLRIIFNAIGLSRDLWRIRQTVPYCPAPRSATCSS